MKKDYFYFIFITILLILIGIFCIQLFFNKNIIGIQSFFLGNDLEDYFADFFNQVRLVYSEKVYDGGSYSILAERALPPLQYLLLIPFSKCANFNQIPTVLLNRYSFSVEVGKTLLISNYIFMIVSVMFFLLLYENLNLKNKFFKFMIMFLLVFSYPLLYVFQRGNIVILAALATAFFLFNYQSENKIKKIFSLITLSFAMALKPLPIIFLLLLLFEKRYKDILITSGVAILISLICFLCLGGLNNIPLYFRNIIIHQAIYGYVSYPFTNLIAFLTLFMFFFKEHWKKCFAVVLLILTCVPRGYNFLFLFPVIIMFLNKEKFSKIDILFGIIFIFLITPIRFFADNIIYCYICEVILIINLIIEKIKTSDIKRLKSDN